MSHLSLSTESVSAINFVRCHYLRQKPTDRTTSIIVRFESFNDRSKVWECAGSWLQQSCTYRKISPVAIIKRRNKLRPIMKKASLSNDYQRNVSICRNKLIYNGVPHWVDDLVALPNTINPRTVSEKKTDSALVFGGVLSDYHELSNFF